MKNTFKYLTVAAIAVLIALPATALAGDKYHTVNGSIKVGDNTKAGSIESVNGSIRIGADSFVESVESVNGSVELANGVSVGRSVEAVNGSVALQPGCEVGSNVETVNGGIRLQNTRVSGDVETVNGHIRILDGSEVSGNVVVRKPGGWGWGKRDKPVRVEIGKDVTVHGNLVFEHAVELEIHDTARVGEIIGEDVEIVSSS